MAAGAKIGSVRVNRLAALLPLLVAGAVASAGFAAEPAKAPLEIRTVTYGTNVTLTAKSPVDSGARAIVLGQACGFHQFVTLTSKHLGPRASFSYVIAPTLTTSYRVLIADRQVVTLTVRVRPAIKITRVTGNRYRVELVTGNGSGLGGRLVTLQRRTPSGSWANAGTVHLKLVSRVDEINAVAAGTGVARRAGKVRAVLSARQAAPCFAATISAPTD